MDTVHHAASPNVKLTGAPLLRCSIRDLFDFVCVFFSGTRKLLG